MRGFVVLGHLFPFVIAFVRDRRRFILFGHGARRTPEQHRRRAERLTRTLARLGPTYIKLAQVLAARADLLPEPYLGAIGTLTDQVPPLRPGVAEQVVREELGRSVDAVFERFDSEPLAAASLGQVHRAAYGGREVVVKILRPGVDGLVRQDLDVAFRLLFVLNVLFPNHHVRALSAIVNEFSKRIWQELDFREEARNADTLRRNFAGEPRVVVPRVIEEMTHRRVLVLEYIDGTRIDRLHARLASGELQLQTLMATLVDVYIKMMLEDGLFHADPHPGNLLVDAEGRVVLLDFGMVIRVERAVQARLVRTILAAVHRDVDGVINGFYELGILDPEVDRGTVRDAARQLMAISIRDDLSSRQVQHLVEQILRTFYDWPLMLPADFVYFGRAAVLVEGIGFRYDPDFNAIATARPVVERAAARLITGLGEAGGATRLLDWGFEAAGAVRTLRDLLQRVEREEFRVRWHPRDTLELQRFMAQQVRRALLGLFALTTALVGSVIYLATRRVEILILGLVAALGMFLVILVLPSHLFENPLRFRRRWPGG